MVMIHNVDDDDYVDNEDDDFYDDDDDDDNDSHIDDDYVDDEDDGMAVQTLTKFAAILLQGDTTVFKQRS